VPVRGRGLGGTHAQSVDGRERIRCASSNSGDVTLGFHEKCHQDDYEAYLKSHPLPDLPILHVGMTGGEYNQAIAAFNEKLKAYFKTMKAESVSKTDEAGYSKSTYEKTGKPYHHMIPTK